jgi:aerobic carbon-monoxide dehydrogenase medium subunit
VTAGAIEWLAPSTLPDAIDIRAERGEGATVLAGGTFVGILMNQGFLRPAALLSLGGVAELRRIAVSGDGELRVGAMVTHRAIERDPRVVAGWPALARTFGVVASPRVRNQATVGGVLADADYASDPPAMFQALGAAAVLRSPRGERVVPVAELILGHYETCIAPDELLVEVRVPPAPERAVYRKFRSRSSEDRPCVAVAASLRAGALRVVVGAVAGRPQEFSEVCAGAAGRGIDAAVAREVGAAYAERVAAIDDARGSAAYRRRVVAVEVRRAVEELGA